MAGWVSSPRPFTDSDCGCSGSNVGSGMSDQPNAYRPYEIVRRTAKHWAASGQTPETIRQSRTMMVASLPDDDILRDVATTYLMAVERVLAGEPVEAAAAPFAAAVEFATLAGWTDLGNLFAGLPPEDPEP